MTSRSDFRKLMIAVLVACGFALGNAYAQSSVLRIATTANPPTLDPMFSPARATADIAMNVFETLVGWGEDYSIKPKLAESWDISDDGLTYTFHLYPNVKFQNGNTVTASDVKASLERMLQISPLKSRLQSITSIDAVDPLTVKIQLSQPTGPLLEDLANPQASILPVEAIQGKAGGKAELIGSGPYKVAQWLPDQYVELKRFDGYTQRPGTFSGDTGQLKACVPDVKFIPVPEAASRANGLQSGQYDIADFLPYGAGRRLQRDNSVKIVEDKNHMMPMMYFNFAKGRITTNEKIRQAIQAALNMNDMMQIASEGFGSLDPSFYFGQWQTDAGSSLYNQDNPEKAKSLMKEAGYSGQPLTLITNTSYNVMYQSALVIQRQLEQVGFNVKLQVYDWAGSLQARSDGNWDLFMSGHLLMADPSGIEFHLEPATSPFKYDNPHVTDLLHQADQVTGFEQRKAIYTQLQSYLYQTAAWVKLFDQNVFQGVRSNVTGYQPWSFMRAFNVCLSQ